MDGGAIVQRQRLNGMLDARAGVLQDYYKAITGCQLEVNGGFHDQFCQLINFFCLGVMGGSLLPH